MPRLHTRLEEWCPAPNLLTKQDRDQKDCILICSEVTCLAAGSLRSGCGPSSGKPLGSPSISPPETLSALHLPIPKLVDDGGQEQLLIESLDHRSSSQSSTDVSDVYQLLALGSGIGFRSKISRGGSTLGEEAGEDWLDEGTKHDLSATCLGKSHPHDKDKFKCVVKGCESLADEHNHFVHGTYETSKQR